MCGIAGFFNLHLAETDSKTLLKTMCDSIAHRGPDDEGYFSDEFVGMGMRRLSIIDLTGGHQPIYNEDETKLIIFNGEIYNFAELRHNLEQYGHRFKTSSDTEVILHQYEKDGEQCVNKFNGMFAFAIWDKTVKKLFLARDRMGVKPLYYYWDNHSLIFASEIKAILVSKHTPRTINPQAMFDYLTFRYIPQPETIWNNIYKLPPGHTLSVSIDSPVPSVQRYWDIPYSDNIPVKGKSEYIEEFEHLFIDSVRLRLIADVPVGILLSGGLDSSCVAAAVAKTHNGKLSSFSIAFKESPAINELPYARQVAKYVQTDHHEVVIGEQEFCDFLPRFVYYSDEPLADLASVPLYYVSDLARQKVKVVLSGEGSDEVLAGYHFDKIQRKLDMLRLFQKLPVLLRKNIIGGITRIFGNGAYQKFQQINTQHEQYFKESPLNMTNYLNSNEKEKLLNIQMKFDNSMDKVRHEVKRVNTNNPLHQLLFIYCQSWLVEDLLMKADKMTMANSIELRVPFLDYRLVEWAAQSPSWLKVGINNRKQYETKWILRQFAKQYLPKQIIDRPKMGFPVPVYDWLNGRLKRWAADIILSNDAMLYQWFRPQQVKEQLRRGIQKNAHILDRHRLWNLIILELWLREWKPQ